MANTTTANSKKWWQSKTLLMNIAAIIGDACTFYVSGGTITAVSLANIVLRAFTKTAIAR